MSVRWWQRVLSTPLLKVQKTPVFEVSRDPAGLLRCTRPWDFSYLACIHSLGRFPFWRKGLSGKRLPGTYLQQRADLERTDSDLISTPGTRQKKDPHRTRPRTKPAYTRQSGKTRTASPFSSCNTQSTACWAGRGVRRARGGPPPLI